MKKSQLFEFVVFMFAGMFFARWNASAGLQGTQLFLAGLKWFIGITLVLMFFKFVFKLQAVREFTFAFLEFIDDYINHKIIERVFFNGDPVDKDGNERLPYKIWERTSYAFCQWLNIKLHDRWFGDSE